MPRQLSKVGVLILLLAAPVFGRVQLPAQPRQYVEDLANVIDTAHEQRLNGVLQELEQKTGAQYIILTVDTTGGTAIAQFSVELAHDQWRLGQQGKDNGMLFVLAAADRKYWFTPGRGLEGFLTDNYLGRLGREVLVPYLKRNQYGEGIYQANLQAIKRIADGAGVTLTGMPNLPRSRQPGQRRLPGCSSLFFLLMMMLFIGGMGGGMRRGLGGWLLLPMLFGGFGGYGGYGRSGRYGGGGFGGSSGGFGGGGFGGFGGGGGGGFSGGGAGGGW